MMPMHSVQGKLKNLDFLNDDDKKTSNKSKPAKKKTGNKPKTSAKRAARDDKFGFSGNQCGSKPNTKGSFLEVNKKTMKKGGYFVDVIYVFLNSILK